MQNRELHKKAVPVCLDTMTLNFDPTLILKESQWRPTNQWKPRSLTSAARVHYVAAKLEQESAACEAGVAAKEASYVATQLARQDGRPGPKDLPAQGARPAEGMGWARAEVRGDRGGQPRSAGPGQKVALQPSVLLFGQNGSERVRVTRCRSADHQGPASCRPPLTRSTGSPYLEDQHVQHASPLALSFPHQRRHHHHQQQPPQQRSLDGSRPPGASSGGGGGSRNPGRRHNDDVKTSPRRQGEDVRPSPRRQGDDVKASARRAGEEVERIGRCQPGTAMPFYKAALALMQAQRQRASLQLFPPSPSPSSTHTSPASSPRGSLTQQDHHHHHHHHHHHRHGGLRQRQHHQYQVGQPAKSILRPSAGRGDRARHGHPLLATSSPLPETPRHVATQPTRPRPPLPVASRKKVTFGDDVIVQLQPEVGMTARVLSHMV